MKFLVYEKNLFVRNDISEILMGAFSGVVHFVEDLHEFTGQQSDDSSQSVLIVSVANHLMLDRCKSRSAIVAHVGVVIISDESVDPSEGPSSTQFIVRPFSADILVDAVKNVLSFRLKDPS